jgi:hypothetical protein
MNTTMIDKLRMTRLAGAAQANLEDAVLWRWYSDMMEDRRIVAKPTNGKWVVKVDREECAGSVSFDTAIRKAFQLTGTRARKSDEQRPDCETTVSLESQ